MRKIFTLFVATLLCVAGIQAKTIYLNTGGSELWETDGAACDELKLGTFKYFNDIERNNLDPKTLL